MAKPFPISYALGDDNLIWCIALINHLVSKCQSVWQTAADFLPSLTQANGAHLLETPAHYGIYLKLAAKLQKKAESPQLTAVT